jgi:formamidopyrimidine-DNA glycosylase
MPELPEVETIARKLRPELVGRTVAAVEVLWQRTIDRPPVDRFSAAVTGARFTGVGRRGKFLVLEMDTGKVLLVHLRMSGKFTLRSAEEGPGDFKHARVRMQLDDGTWLIYVDPRKFGRFYLVDNVEEIVEPLGPEPLEAAFTAERLNRMLEGRRGEIKRLLLNQHFIAGLGNIYASEALWHARIHPCRSAGSLSDEETQRLHGAIVDVLRQGIRHGGTSLDDGQYVYPDGGLGAYQQRLKVYDRAGDQCPRCGYTLERIVQGQRSTYVCPACQPEEPRDV